VEWHDRIGRRLTLRSLHTLVTVVRRRSMAKAAAELAITQPAVSRMVADMEHTLGVRLLDRKPQGVEPTLYGEALLKWGDTVFEDLRHAVREIQSLADPCAGDIWIGGNSPMVEGLLPAAIDLHSRQYPRIVFHVTQVTVPAQSFAELRARKLDLFVGRLPQRHMDSDLNAEILFEEPLLVMAGVNNRWGKRRRVELADLMDEPWVLPQPESAVGSVIAEAFRASGLDLPQQGVICSGLQFTYAMVATGRYLGMFPRSLFHFGGKRFAIEALPLDLPIKPRPVAVVTLKNRTTSPAVERFIDSLRTVAEPVADRTGRRARRGPALPKRRSS
jgi:DNA-binding transcriptional LysR family regulator